MLKSISGRVILPTATLALGILIGSVVSPLSSVQAQSDGRTFELRTYTAPEGKLPELQARFRDHTIRLFGKHGIRSIGYFTPEDAPQSSSTLVYLVAHTSREAAKKSWDDFRNDPEWQKAATESEANGKIVAKIESVYLDALDFSPLQ